MPTHDPRINAYINKSADFAQPILKHLRMIIHKGCPDVQEEIKWGFPHFAYNGLLCSMASFKQHCAFGFWKGSLLADVMKNDLSNEAMGQFGRIAQLSDLPSDRLLLTYIKEAVRLNAAGIKIARTPKPKSTKAPAGMPADFASALKKNKRALSTYEGFSASNQREYIEWITEAKTEATKIKRMTTAIEWMAEGKVRNWKYVKK